MMRAEIVDLAQSEMRQVNFDSLAVADLDFSNHTFSSFEITDRHLLSDKPKHYFDLASITKPLTLASCRLVHPEYFKDNEKMNLLLNHRAGLTSGGRLPKVGWREQLLAYDIKESPTLYSDYSALRLQLEIESRAKKSLELIVSEYLDREVLHWKKLTQNMKVVISGESGSQVLRGEVNDENARVIGQFTSHAGLFATVDGLARTLLDLDQNYNLCTYMRGAFKSHNNAERFIHGFDRVENPLLSKASKKASLMTFGHLGFTGTSFWIDLEKNRGSIILSNATRYYSYEKSSLDRLRLRLGEAIFTL